MARPSSRLTSTTTAVRMIVVTTAPRSRALPKTSMKLSKPVKPRSAGNRAFHSMNETTSVTAKGSCVRTIVNTSAGSSGSRRRRACFFSYAAAPDGGS